MNIYHFQNEQLLEGNLKPLTKTVSSDFIMAPVRMRNTMSSRGLNLCRSYKSSCNHKLSFYKDLLHNRLHNTALKWATACNSRLNEISQSNTTACIQKVHSRSYSHSLSVTEILLLAINRGESSFLINEKVKHWKSSSYSSGDTVMKTLCTV